MLEEGVLFCFVQEIFYQAGWISMLSEAGVLFKDFTGFYETLSWKVLVAKLLFIP